MRISEPGLRPVHARAYRCTYGHRSGDEALRNVAAVARENVFRPHNTVARYGGEEFAIVLPFTDLAGATEVAERLASAAQFPHQPHHHGTPGRDRAARFALDTRSSADKPERTTGPLTLD